MSYKNKNPIMEHHDNENIYFSIDRRHIMLYLKIYQIYTSTQFLSFHYKFKEMI